MGRIVAVANQKGGVAKTTTVVSLGAALYENGLRVLVVDLDPQSSLTFSLGADPEDVVAGTAEVLLGAAEVGAATLVTEEGPHLLPASIDLAGAEAMLLPRPQRERVLREALEQVTGRYDVVLIDCSPTLGLLTLNALTAADEVVVPLQCEMLGHRGVGQLLDTVDDVRRLANPRLRVRGLLPTMFDARSAHQRAVLADLEERYGVPVLPPVPRSVRFAEAPGKGRSILRSSGRSAGARAYREVAAELMRRWRVRPRTATTRTTRTGDRAGDRA